MRDAAFKTENNFNEFLTENAFHLRTIGLDGIERVKRLLPLFKRLN